MKITSARLVLRDFRLSDWADLHQLYLKPETIKYNPSGYPENETVTKNMVMEWTVQHELADRKNYTLAISDSTGFIGVISLNLGKAKYRNAEAWYKLDPGRWNDGFATESLNAMLKFGFETLDLHRIECGCSIHNTASYRVMEKAGMTREGVKRQHLPFSKGWHDACIYAILKEEFTVKN